MKPRDRPGRIIRFPASGAWTLQSADRPRPGRLRFDAQLAVQYDLPGAAAIPEWTTPCYAEWLAGKQHLLGSVRLSIHPSTEDRPHPLGHQHRTARSGRPDFWSPQSSTGTHRL